MIPSVFCGEASLVSSSSFCRTHKYDYFTTFMAVVAVWKVSEELGDCKYNGKVPSILYRIDDGSTLVVQGPRNH